MKYSAIVLCIAVILSGERPVASEPVSFAFTGVVSSTNKPGTFPPGQPVVGLYTFESTTADDNPLNPEQGHYFGALISFSFTSGAYSALADESNSDNDGGNILVNRNTVFNPHQYEVSLGRDLFLDPRWGPDVAGEQLWRMRILLADAGGTAIKSEELPLVPPDLGDFTSRTFGLIFETDATNAPGVVFELQTLSLFLTPVEQTTWGSIKQLYAE